MKIKLFCHIHGFIDRKYVTTVKSCGLCMEELNCAAGQAPTLERIPVEDGVLPRKEIDRLRELRICLTCRKHINGISIDGFCSDYCAARWSNP